ncbi:MAG: hypothetical protein ACLUO4_00670 [Christensenellales bacterium]
MKKRVGWLCLVLTGILLCGCAPKKQASTIYMGDVLAIAGVKTGDSMKVGFRTMGDRTKVSRQSRLARVWRR